MPVDQCRLPDIGAPDDGHNWHWGVRDAAVLEEGLTIDEDLVFVTELEFVQSDPQRGRQVGFVVHGEGLVSWMQRKGPIVPHHICPRERSAQAFPVKDAVPPHERSEEAGGKAPQSSRSRVSAIRFNSSSQRPPRGYCHITRSDP